MLKLKTTLEDSEKIIMDYKDSYGSFYVLIDRNRGDVTFFSKTDNKKSFSMRLDRGEVNNIIKYNLD